MTDSPADAPPAGSSPPMSAAATAKLLSDWRIRIFFSTWLAYAGYYLTRKSLSVAKIGLGEDFDWSKEQLGIIDSAYLWAYALGQFLNGPLADTLGPRRIAAIGMGVSILTAFVSGFSTGLGVFVVLWLLQGLGQATGWTSLLKIMSSWFTSGERGRIMGWWCTNYSVGGLLAPIVAGYCVALMGRADGAWRAAYVGPALMLGVVLAIFLWLVRDRPEDVGLPAVEEVQGAPQEVLVAGESPSAEPEGSWKVLAEVFSNPIVWVLGIAYLCLKPARYLVILWAPLYIHEALGENAFRSSIISISFEFFGMAGTIAAGYASDKLFGARRFPICAIMLALTGVTLVFLDETVMRGPLAAVAVLGALGFFLYGPDSLLSGATAMDFGTKKAAATASGFINGMGSVGSAVASGWLAGWFSQKYGWDVLFPALGGFAFLAALLLVPYWNARPPTAPGK